MAARAAPSLLLAVIAATGCARPPPGDEPARVATAEPLQLPAAAPAAQTPTPPADPFTASVRPILAKSCAPCHEPNGKMYEKLPFDNARVVSSHSEGVLKRLKGSEKETVERWITSLPEEARASSEKW